MNQYERDLETTVQAEDSMPTGSTRHDKSPRRELRMSWLPVLIRKDLLLLALLMAVAILSEFPFFYAAHGHLPQAHDITVHWMRAVQFDETLRSGVWYPRWLGGMNYGYGAATTLFYAPFVYYATSASHALLGDWSRAIEAVVLVTAAASGVTFFLYARTFLDGAASTIATLLYLLLPYRLIDLYHRAALSELIAFVWMPLVLFAINSATKRLSARRIIGGAIAYDLLVVTHPPVAYLFSIALIVFIVAMSVVERNGRIIASGSCVIALGAALSAFYSLPATLEVGLVKQNVTQFFREKKGYITDLAANAGFERLLAASALLTFILLLLFVMQSKMAGENASRHSLARRQRIGWMAVGLLAFFMMTPAAAPFERLMPGISGIAFAWRWQAIEGIAVALLAGLATEVLMRSRLSHRRFNIVGLSLTTLAVIAFGVVGCAMASNLTVIFIPPTEAVEEDFTPAGSPGIAELTKDAAARITPAQAESSVRLIHWKPQGRVFETSNATDATMEVPTFMFPGWTALIDGQKVSPRSARGLGTILVDLPPGDHTVTLIFSNTRTRRLAEQISLAAAALCAILFIASFVHRNRLRDPRSS